MVVSIETSTVFLDQLKELSNCYITTDPDEPIQPHTIGCCTSPALWSEKRMYLLNLDQGTLISQMTKIIRL